MKIPSKNTLVIALLVLVAVGWAAMSSNKSPQAGCCSSLTAPTAIASEAPSVAPSPAAGSNVAVVASPTPTATTAPIPRLLDLGADRCIPCKMMVPILEQLEKEYKGRLQVDFIDVWKDPGAGNKYGISSIPTQIFFDATGKELFRHQGFFGKEDILVKWKKLGVDLGR